MVAVGIGLHHLHRLQLLQPRLLSNLILALVGIVLQVTYIRDVPHIADLVAQILEQLEQHIIRNARTRVPKMGIAINRRAAHIHPHMTGLDGLEKLLLPAHRIGEK